MSEPREVACLCKDSGCEQLIVDGCQVIFDFAKGIQQAKLPVTVALEGAHAS